MVQKRIDGVWKAYIKPYLIYCDCPWRTIGIVRMPSNLFLFLFSFLGMDTEQTLIIPTLVASPVVDPRKACKACTCKIYYYYSCL